KATERSRSLTLSTTWPSLPMRNGRPCGRCRFFSLSGSKPIAFPSAIRVFGLVDIDEPELGEPCPHAVNIEADLARSETRACAGLLLLALAACSQNALGRAARHDGHAVVVGDDHVARPHVGARADERDIDAAQR